MTVFEAIILIAGGFVAGGVNAMAGGGSLLTVPLLTLMIGLPAGVANGTNRVGVLVSNASSQWQFRRGGFSGLGPAVKILIPVAIGSVIGSFLISLVADDTFKVIFGIAMVPLLLLSLRPPKPRNHVAPSEPTRDEAKAPTQNSAHGPVSGLGNGSGTQMAWSPTVFYIVFFLIGLYGGALQAGVGVILLLALSRSGIDLVLANSIKTVVIFAITAVAVPVFIARGQVDWIPALLLAIGFVGGGAAGAKLAVVGGEKVIRPVLVVAVLALAGRMLGLY